MFIIGFVINYTGINYVLIFIILLQDKLFDTIFKQNKTIYQIAGDTM